MSLRDAIHELLDEIQLLRPETRRQMLHLLVDLLAGITTHLRDLRTGRAYCDLQELHEGAMK